MKAWFYHGHGEWQFEFLIWRLQVRIGSQQQAAWWHKGPPIKHGDYVWLFNTGKRARACRASNEGR